MQHVQSDRVSAGRDSGQSRTQIWVALIGATATITTAVAGYILAGHGGHTATGSTHQQLSGLAATLVDEHAEDCSGGGPDAARNDWVTITSPASGTEVGGEVPVEGTVKLLGGNHLYLFSYAPGLCEYYFNPPEPLHPGPNGGWNHEAVLSESGGATIPLIAAVVDDKTEAAFKDIIGLAKDEAPFLRRLPQVPSAKISVHVRRS